jgi:hypothetical protein
MAKEYAGRQMREIVETADREVAPVESVRRSTSSVVVGAADDHAEIQADAVASQVMARLAGFGDESHAHGPGCGHPAPVQRSLGGDQSPIGFEGGVLPGDATADLAASRGGGAPLDLDVRRRMEAGFGRDLPADIRVHTDQRADRLAAQMGAVAFTHGSDIHFSAGAYAPDTAGGQQLLAHELTHVVQQRGSVVAPSAQRKLRGTAQALESQGGGQSTGGLRKVLGRLTNWDKLVAVVRDYEAQEGALLGAGNPSVPVLNQAKGRLLKLLTKAQRYAEEWRDANRDEEETGKRRGKKNQDSDDRTKAGRRQAVNMVVPRIKNETQILSGDGKAWMSSLGLSSAQEKSTGVTKSGAMNEVKQITYTSESGEFTGYFKEDKGFNNDRQSHEKKVGISQFDPNYGARAVALYRLDQLFDAGVTARAEFAVRTITKDGTTRTVMGTVLEEAKGETGLDSPLRAGGDDSTGQTIDFTDPKLQRALNKLQLLDALAGQLDRHIGNFVLSGDGQGGLGGVKGIDLDMAFGEKMLTPEKQSAPGAHNYVGLPDFIDAEMGEKFLTITPADLTQALTGLLSDAEIQATVMRFGTIQRAILKAKQEGKLRDTYDDDTAMEGPSYEDMRSKGHGNYTQALRIAWRGQVEERMSHEFTDLAKHRFDHDPMLQDLTPTLDRVLRGYLQASVFEGTGFKTSNSKLVKVAGQFLYENNVPDKFADGLVAILVDELFKAIGKLNLNRLIVMEQEGANFLELDAHVKVLESVVTSPQLLARFKALTGRG